MNQFQIAILSFIVFKVLLTVSAILGLFWWARGLNEMRVTIGSQRFRWIFPVVMGFVGLSAFFLIRLLHSS